MILIFPQPYILSISCTLFTLSYICNYYVDVLFTCTWVLYLPTYTECREQSQHIVLFVWSAKGQSYVQQWSLDKCWMIPKEDKLIFILQRPYSPTLSIIFSSLHWDPTFSMSLLNHNTPRIKRSCRRFQRYQCGKIYTDELSQIIILKKAKTKGSQPKIPMTW